VKIADSESVSMMSARARVPAIGLVAALFVLAGCAATETYVPRQEPAFYRDLGKPGAVLDTAMAAAMISEYRTNNNLPAVTIDPQLTKLAQAQTEIMAKRDRLDHNAGKPFVARLKASGYDAKGAAENISAGYHTLAEAFSGWRDSPPHRANMQLKGATRMGIAAVYTPSSKFKVYWTLILAEPDVK
jgi:uncharacterized protein YkwD